MFVLFADLEWWVSNWKKKQPGTVIRNSHQHANWWSKTGIFSEEGLFYSSHFPIISWNKLVEKIHFLKLSSLKGKQFNYVQNISNKKFCKGTGCSKWFPDLVRKTYFFKIFFIFMQFQIFVKYAGRKFLFFDWIKLTYGQLQKCTCYFAQKFS